MNLARLYRQLERLFADDFTCLTLGLVDGWPLWYFVPKTVGPIRATIVTGVHGNEPAPLVALLLHLRQRQRSKAQQALHSASTTPSLCERTRHLSYLPMLNPTGIRDGTRTNARGQDPNRGYFTGLVSEEGQQMIRHTDLLLHHSQHGLLSLHEDLDQGQFYLYTLEKQRSAFTGGMAQALPQPRFTGEVEGTWIENGLCHNVFLPDGAFEDYLHLKGVARVVVTETPGKQPLKRRVQANLHYIEVFADLTRTLALRTMDR
jgi:hypothetical protein